MSTMDFSEKEGGGDVLKLDCGDNCATLNL